MSCCVAAHPTDTAPPCATYKAKVGVLLLKRLGKQAVALTQDAMAALLNEDSPAELGRQARQRFWAAFHEACAVLQQDASNWRLPIPPPAALTPA